MVTIHRAHGLRIVIYTDDHEPAHVHVFGDGHAKINLAGPEGGPELVWAEEMKRNELRRDGCRDRTQGRISGTMERDTWLT
ncbi:DUF4160 domain-containing protein [Paracoccus versutus]|uniref:DUF4160 domain-containing protein n=1 Tax=Paracoccus versutus TaxID=34007 RepID=UPI000DF7DE0B|nr:DUF4160 domain-containing protein [Paracoccus versutus]RDD70293.1 DUF4160 domain-containing protein [Paracoccus versutus]